MKLLTTEFADLTRRAIEAAQAADALPAFDIPDIPVNQVAKDNATRGDYAVPVAMQLARAAKRAPRQIAEAIMQHLPPADFVERVEIAGPGYLNFWLSKAWLAAQVETIIGEGANAGSIDLGAGKRAQVEFVSANPSGPITIAHTRGAVMGDTLANLLEAAGYEVEREYYFNNAGQQMQKLGRSLQARYLEMLGAPFEFPEDGYQGQYIRWIAAVLMHERGDKLKDSDWATFKSLAENIIFGHIRNSLRGIGLEFDNWFNENSLYENGAIDQMLKTLGERGHTYESEGAIWFCMTEFGGDKDRVLVKSTGEPTYVTPDIAYHIDKLERGFDLAVNILGADHAAQYPVVAAGVEAMGYDPSPIRVLIHQAVTLVEGGEAQRMSKRKGRFVTLDELVDEVGRDAVRYFILAYKPDAHLNFDLERAKTQSDENPVFTIQYANMRCMSIFRRAAEEGIGDAGADLSLLTGERELRLIRKLLELPQIIEFAVEAMEPHHLTTYALELARVLNSTYETVRALGAGTPELVKARLRFYRAAQVVLARVLTLMGMTTPERM